MRRGLGWAGLRWVAGWAGPEASLSHDGWVAGCRAAGLPWNLGWAGWAELCLGGLLDGQGLFHTHLGLRLGGELLAGLGQARRPVGPDASEVKASQPD